MTNAAQLDVLFREAVAAIDTGDVPSVERLTREHPELVRERLAAPGEWLRSKVGNALSGFFKAPYLLWFVAEDPVRNDALPQNIADVARTLVEAARRERVSSLQEQLDYALRLVAWSWVAKRCGVQLGLIDVLIDAGASLEGVPDSALVNGHVDAAERLVQRGAPLTLATALILGRWGEGERLAATTSARDKRMALVLAALNGKAEAIVRLASLADVDVSAVSEDLYAHATPLHHAVCSGSLSTVQALVNAGASLTAKDSAYAGTPLGWAEHFEGEAPDAEAQARYTAIKEYLRAAGA
jgi:peptide-methionine (S)-S-oxide reductase